jgi:poly(A) polymerase
MDITSLKKNKAITMIKKAAKDTASEVYIVGGVLRDLYLKKESRDFDFIVFGDIDILTEKAAKLMNRPLIHIGSGDKKVIRIVKGAASYDFTPAKGATLAEDLTRRDFTVNTLAYSINTGELIDLKDAKPDINSGIIRAVGDDTFDDDPLRMLRAFRFHASLGFTLDDATLKVISRKKEKIKRIAPERIREELFKILAVKDSFRTIRLMAESGLLYEIFPELIDSIGCAQNDWHHLDVMEHTLDAYRNLEEILSRLHDYFYNVSSELEEFLSRRDNIPQLKYAILLHDVAKPLTKCIDDEGRTRFFKHAEEGGRIAAVINERLKLSKKDSAFICEVIRQHLRIVPFLRALDEGGVDAVNKKSITRYFIRLKDIGVYEILHNLADLMASKGILRASQSGVEEATELSRVMLDIYFNEYMVRKKNPPLVTGSDLIETYGLSPSPIFSKILDTVYQKQLAGEVRNAEEAAVVIEKLLRPLPSS